MKKPEGGTDSDRLSKGNRKKNQQTGREVVHNGNGARQTTQETVIER